MFRAFLAFITRRRRRNFIILKLFVFLYVIILLLMSQSHIIQQYGGSSANEGRGPEKDSGNDYFDDLIVDVDEDQVAVNQINSMSNADSSEKEKRKITLLENTDEFLKPVLRGVQYVEMDLSVRRGLISYNDFDDEIEDDLKRVKPKSGEKANVSNFQKKADDKLPSEIMSANRSVPDTREAACRNEVFDDELPNMSVIIVYTNEAFTSLIRTLLSVINRTPAKLLREIVLVDDFSDHRDLEGNLGKYISTHFLAGKIRLVKLSKRSGLIRGRMIGAHVAVGDVLIFLSVHCEVNKQWVEPLLQRIKEDRTVVVCPVVDFIDPNTMEYLHVNGEVFKIGGFSWKGRFIWIDIPEYEAQRKKYHHSPTRSPTMAGDMFGIDREYFWEIGSYDSDMQLWGGENLEMSFRIWQCGGSVEIIPCSRVGHITGLEFRPNPVSNNDAAAVNMARVAEVWMEEYKELFYSQRKELMTANWGDVSKRLAFKKRQKCKSFKWYLENVYKEKFQMQFTSKFYGQVKNAQSNQCLDNMQHEEFDEYPLALYFCHSQLHPSQFFMLSNKGELRRESECASVGGSNGKVEMIRCEHLQPEDLWNYESHQLYNKLAEKCLTAKLVDGNYYHAVLETCTGAANQQWVFIPIIIKTIKKAIHASDIAS